MFRIGSFTFSFLIFRILLLFCICLCAFWFKSLFYNILSAYLITIKYIERDVLNTYIIQTYTFLLIEKKKRSNFFQFTLIALNRINFCVCSLYFDLLFGVLNIYGPINTAIELIFPLYLILSIQYSIRFFFFYLFSLCRLLCFLSEIVKFH